jgi:AcrR family transcriptional regulator
VLAQIVAWAQSRDEVRGALLVGSVARRESPADAYSDLDVVLLVGDPRRRADRGLILGSMAATPTVLATRQSDVHLARRWEIWHASAPLFERHGFRGVTINQLAHANAMSPAGLYHYFPNKQAIALFPLAHANGLCRAWDALVAEMPPDPLPRLRAMVDFSADNAEAWRLALGLVAEMARTPTLEKYASRLLEGAREDFATIARSVDPQLSDRRVADLYEAFSAIVVTTMPGHDRSTDALRRRLADAIRGWLVAAGLDPAAFDAAGSDEAGGGVSQRDSAGSTPSVDAASATS